MTVSVSHRVFEELDSSKEVAKVIKDCNPITFVPVTMRGNEITGSSVKGQRIYYVKSSLMEQSTVTKAADNIEAIITRATSIGPSELFRCAGFGELRLR